MIIMRLKLVNIACFLDSELCFAPQLNGKVNDAIPYGQLEGCPSFLFKRVNILMGANASGKTVFGRVLLAILDYVASGHFKYTAFKPYINDRTKPSGFEIDVVHTLRKKLFRINVEFTIPELEQHTSNYSSVHMQVITLQADIESSDSYEDCVKKLKQVHQHHNQYSARSMIVNPIFKEDYDRTLPFLNYTDILHQFILSEEQDTLEDYYRFLGIYGDLCTKMIISFNFG